MRASSHPPALLKPAAAPARFNRNGLTAQQREYASAVSVPQDPVAVAVAARPGLQPPIPADCPAARRSPPPVAPARTPSRAAPSARISFTHRTRVNSVSNRTRGVLRVPAPPSEAPVTGSPTDVARTVATARQRAPVPAAADLPFHRADHPAGGSVPAGVRRHHHTSAAGSAVQPGHGTSPRSRPAP